MKKAPPLQAIYKSLFFLALALVPSFALADTMTFNALSGDAAVCGQAPLSSWQSLRDGGYSGHDVENGNTADIEADKGGSAFQLCRYFLTFDLSALSGQTIDSANFILQPSDSGTNADAHTMYIELTSSTHSDIITLADFTTMGSTVFTKHNWNTYSTGVDNTSPLNSDGITALSSAQGGAWKLAVSTDWDIENTHQPTSAFNYITTKTAELGDTVSPRLVVTYHGSAPPPPPPTNSYKSGISLGNTAVAATAVGDYGVNPLQSTFQKNIPWIGFFIGFPLFIGLGYWFVKRATYFAGLNADDDTPLSSIDNKEANYATGKSLADYERDRASGKA